MSSCLLWGQMLGRPKSATWVPVLTPFPPSSTIFNLPLNPAIWLPKHLSLICSLLSVFIVTTLNSQSPLLFAFYLAPLQATLATATRVFEEISPIIFLLGKSLSVVFYCYCSLDKEHQFTLVPSLTLVSKHLNYWIMFRSLKATSSQFYICLPETVSRLKLYLLLSLYLYAIDWMFVSTTSCPPPLQIHLKASISNVTVYEDRTFRR